MSETTVYTTPLAVLVAVETRVSDQEVALGIEDRTGSLDARLGRVLDRLTAPPEPRPAPVSPAGETTETLNNAQDFELTAVEAALRELERATHVGFAGRPAERLRHLVRYYERVGTEALVAAQQFREDAVVQLRALSLCVDMVGSAHTHAEKAARLRGLSELLEGSIKALRDIQFDEYTRGRYWPDVFRSDYPTRRLLDEVRQRDRQLAEQAAEIARLKGQPVTLVDTDEPLAPLPF